MCKINARQWGIRVNCRLYGQCIRWYKHRLYFTTIWASQGIINFLENFGLTKWQKLGENFRVKIRVKIARDSPGTNRNRSQLKLTGGHLMTRRQLRLRWWAPWWAWHTRAAWAKENKQRVQRRAQRRARRRAALHKQAEQGCEEQGSKLTRKNPKHLLTWKSCQAGALTVAWSDKNNMCKRLWRALGDMEIICL